MEMEFDPRTLPIKSVQETDLPEACPEKQTVKKAGSGTFGSITPFCVKDELLKVNPSLCGHVLKEMLISEKEDERKFQTEVGFYRNVSNRLKSQNMHAGQIFPKMDDRYMCMQDTGYTTDDREYPREKIGKFVLEKLGCDGNQVMDFIEGPYTIPMSSPRFDTFVVRYIFYMLSVIRILDIFHKEVGFVHTDNHNANIMFKAKARSVGRVLKEKAKTFSNFLKDQSISQRDLILLLDDFIFDPDVTMMLIDFSDSCSISETAHSLFGNDATTSESRKAKKVESIDFFILLDRFLYDRRMRECVKRVVGGEQVSSTVKLALDCFLGQLKLRIDPDFTMYHATEMRKQYKSMYDIPDVYRQRWFISSFKNKKPTKQDIIREYPNLYSEERIQKRWKAKLKEYEKEKEIHDLLFEILGAWKK